MKTRWSPSCSCCGDEGQCRICGIDGPACTTTTVSDFHRLDAQHPDAGAVGFLRTGRIMGEFQLNNASGNFIAAFDFSDASNYVGVRFRRGLNDAYLVFELYGEVGGSEIAFNPLTDSRQVFVTGSVLSVDWSFCIEFSDENVTVTIVRSGGTGFSHSWIVSGISFDTGYVAYRNDNSSGSIEEYFRHPSEVISGVPCPDCPEANSPTPCVCCPSGIAYQWLLDLSVFDFDDYPGNTTGCDAVGGRSYILKRSPTGCSAFYNAIVGTTCFGLDSLRLDIGMSVFDDVISGIQYCIMLIEIKIEPVPFPLFCSGARDRFHYRKQVAVADLESLCSGTHNLSRQIIDPEIDVPCNAIIVPGTVTISSL